MSIYLVSDTDLTSIANAIRTKGSTNASLTFPTGFVSAIDDISTSGSGGDSGVYQEIVNGTVSSFTEDMQTIRTGAFMFCQSLTTANFPTCTTIGASAFQDCNALTSISFPSCITIDTYAFQNCTSLTSISSPVCTTIGASAFKNCTSLTTANFPSCTTISNYTFQSCTSLTTANFPACTTINLFAFQNCTSLTTANFPACTTVGVSAFQSCYSLNSIIILGKNTSTISNYAFRYCSHLMNLTILRSEGVAPLANVNAFSSTPISTYTTYTNGVRGSIYVPASLVDFYKVATNWVTYSDRITAIPE